jgi:lysophospholipase L1-like esterase
MFTLGGFPVTRVLKHLESKCLAEQPDIVVLQFGATDLIVPIRRQRRRDGGIYAAHRETSTKPASLPYRLKWIIRETIAEVLRLPPVTPPEIYVETMTSIAQKLLEHQVVPVVMSPFVFGGRRSDRIARDCSERLKRALAKYPKAVYVDAYAELDRYPRWEMLIYDGSHLSIEGQIVVAGTLYLSLKNILNNGPDLLKSNNC